METIKPGDTIKDMMRKSAEDPDYKMSDEEIEEFDSALDTITGFKKPGFKEKLKEMFGES